MKHGADFRQASYAVNALNQSTQRTVPGYADIKALAVFNLVGRDSVEP